jgi:hypothetical protein
VRSSVGVPTDAAIASQTNERLHDAHAGAAQRVFDAELVTHYVGPLAARGFDSSHLLELAPSAATTSSA